MSRRGQIVVGSLFALLLVSAPAWAFPPPPQRHHHTPTVGSTFTPPPMPAGAFVHTATGSFNPATGVFMPATTGTKGTSRLFSNNDIFVPSTGTFVPSANGQFVLRTREAFDPKTGTYVPSSTGNFWVATQGTFTSATPGYVQSAQWPFASGNFVNSAAGTYNPATNSFVASTAGASTLASRRDVFVPANGTFVPAANGLFAMTTREAFNPATGTFVPSATGPYTITTRGTFNSATPGEVAPAFVPGAVASNFMNNNGPVFPATPFGHMAQRYERGLLREATLAAGLTNALANATNPYQSASLSNPYAAQGAPVSSYGSSIPYVYPGYGGGSNAATQPVSNVYNPNANQQRPTSVLAAFGIPTEGADVAWPLVFRLLPPDAKRDLLDKLESQMKIAATQALAGNASPAVLRQTKDTIDSLKQWLRNRRSDFAEGTVQEGQDFLRRLEAALRKMDS